MPLRRLSFALLAALVAASPLPATAQTLPPELQAVVPTNVRPYFVVFFVPTAKPWEMSKALFKQHQGHIRKQFEAGVYATAGPILSGGRLKGMLIVNAPTAEAARQVVEGDPLVAAGVAAVEMHPAMLVDLSSVRATYAQ